MNKSVFLVGAALSILAALGSCDDTQSQKAKKQQPETEAEHQLISDPSRAIPELKRRLRQSVKFEEGVILIDSPFGLGVVAPE